MRSTKPPIWLLMSATVASQLALTIFLPSMPALARSFDVAYGTAQLTLSVYLFAFAFAQLAVGPLSDSVGRRPVLLGSLVVFALGSVCCALSPTIEALIASRLIQACGACGGVVLGRAIVRDSRSGPEAPRAMGYMASAMALAPALAPLLGGQLLVHFGWRSSFWFAAGVAVAVLIAALALTWYNGHLAPAARVAGQTITKDQFATRYAIESFRLDYAEARIRTLVGLGYLTGDQETQQLQYIDSAKTSLVSLTLERSIDATLQAKLATENGVTVTGADIDAQLKKEAMIEAQRHAWVIEVEPERDPGVREPTQAQIDAARAKAQQALADLKAGKPWEDVASDRKSTRLNSSHVALSRMPSSA